MAASHIPEFMNALHIPEFMNADLGDAEILVTLFASYDFLFKKLFNTQTINSLCNITVTVILGPTIAAISITKDVNIFLYLVHVFFVQEKGNWKIQLRSQFS